MENIIVFYCFRIMLKQFLVRALRLGQVRGPSVSACSSDEHKNMYYFRVRLSLNNFWAERRLLTSGQARGSSAAATDSKEHENSST